MPPEKVLTEPSGRLGQVEGVQQLTRPRPGRPPAEAEQPAQEHQVLHAGEVLVDRGELAGQGNPPADRVGLPHEVVAQHPRRTGVGSDQGGEHPDRGGLAGAVWSQEAVHRTNGHGQIHAIHGLGPAEGLDQARSLHGQR
jgi:hypothetical protein